MAVGVGVVGGSRLVRGGVSLKWRRVYVFFLFFFLISCGYFRLIDKTARLFLETYICVTILV